MVVNEGAGTWRNLILCTALLYKETKKRECVWFWSGKKQTLPKTWEMAYWDRTGLLIQTAKGNLYNYNFCNAEDQS